MNEEVKLQIGWIKRLKHYTTRVKTATGDSKLIAVGALLGYLESLESLIQ